MLYLPAVPLHTTDGVVDLQDHVGFGDTCKQEEEVITRGRNALLCDEPCNKIISTVIVSDVVFMILKLLHIGDEDIGGMK